MCRSHFAPTPAESYYPNTDLLTIQNHFTYPTLLICIPCLIELFNPMQTRFRCTTHIATLHSSPWSFIFCAFSLRAKTTRTQSLCLSDSAHNLTLQMSPQLNPVHSLFSACSDVTHWAGSIVQIYKFSISLYLFDIL